MSATPTSHVGPAGPATPIDTRAVHAGREDLTSLGVHALPIDLSTTSPLPGVETGGDAYERLAGGEPPLPGQTPVYARLWNGTVARFESGLAALEGAEAAVAFASGMAAMSAVLLALPFDRRHVVAVRPLYGGTDHLLTTGLLDLPWHLPLEEWDEHVVPRLPRLRRDEDGRRRGPFR